MVMRVMSGARGRGRRVVVVDPRGGGEARVAAAATAAQRYRHLNLVVVELLFVLVVLFRQGIVPTEIIIIVTYVNNVFLSGEIDKDVHATYCR